MAPFYLRTIRGKPTITARPTTQQVEGLTSQRL